MKPVKFLMLIFCLTGLWTKAFAVSPNPAPGSSTVAELLEMNAREFAECTGKDLTLKDRLVFGFVKRQLKKEVKKGTLALDTDLYIYQDEVQRKFNIGAFFLGFFLGIIGLAIVLLAFKDKNAWKSAIYGWALFIVLYLILVVALF